MSLFVRIHIYVVKPFFHKLNQKQMCNSHSKKHKLK